MNEPTAPETELDEALEAARQDKTQANYFYDTLLNTDLAAPVQTVGKTDGNWKQLEPHERFQPLFLAFEKTKAMPVFDSLARMKRWAGARQFDYILLRGHQLIGILGDQGGLVVNAGTPWSYTVTPEILEKLRQAMRPVQLT